MKISSSLGWLSLSVLACLAETVPSRFVALSPQVFPATDRDRLTRLDYRMSVSAFRQPSEVNHEFALATAQDAPFTHEGFFLLEDPILFETFPIGFVMDLPFEDFDGSGLPDFFDPAEGVTDLVTIGFHQDGQGGAAEFVATWNRPAGSASGTVRIEMPFFGRTFNHAMSLLAFGGAYEFARSGSNLTGTVALTNLTAESEVISGPFNLRIVNSNTIDFGPATWRSEAGSYPIIPVDRLERAQNSYVAVIVFDDGYPQTPVEDYPVYLLTLDSADADGNGIPDLAQAAAPAARPSLTIQKVPDGVRLGIQGTAGKTYEVQSADEITAANWTREQSVSLGNGTTAELILPLQGGRRFFRLVEE